MIRINKMKVNKIIYKYLTTLILHKNVKYLMKNYKIIFKKMNFKKRN